MIECRHCRELFRGDVERLGSRCPRCRLPLYERPELQRRKAENVENQATCAVHSENLAIGSCARCSATMCGICRTRWFDRTVCASCAEKALLAKEASPEEVFVRRRQARWSFTLACCGWGLLLLGLLLLYAVIRGGPNNELRVLALFTMLASFLPSLFAVGNGLSALRTKGEGFRLAVTGIAMGASLVGLLIGVMLINTWQN